MINEKKIRKIGTKCSVESKTNSINLWIVLKISFHDYGLSIQWSNLLKIGKVPMNHTTAEFSLG